MTYDDQIAWCRQLLESPAILEELRRRDWIVLLDEAQDTDGADVRHPQRGDAPARRAGGGVAG